MLTVKDISMIIQAEREVFLTKAEFEDFRQDFSNLLSAVDGYAKQMKDFFEEHLILTHRTDRLET